MDMTQQFGSSVVEMRLVMPRRVSRYGSRLRYGEVRYSDRRYGNDIRKMSVLLQIYLYC